MAQTLGDLVRNYAGKGILIDTNLLLVLIVGSVDPRQVLRFKRTRSYTPQDFKLLVRLIDRFRRIVVTPHILAELTNLLPTGKADALSAGYFTRLVEVLKAAREEHVAKDTMIDSPLLAKIGFTDLSMMEAANGGKYLVLTDDLAAAAYLRLNGCDVLNFNHVRGMNWFGA